MNTLLRPKNVAPFSRALQLHAMPARVGRLLGLFGVVAFLSAFSSTASAQLYWNVNNSASTTAAPSGTWTAADWGTSTTTSGGTFVSGDSVTFEADGGTNTSSTLSTIALGSTNESVSGITFVNEFWTLSGTAALTIGAGGITENNVTVSDHGSETISTTGGIILSASQNWTNNNVFNATNNLVIGASGAATNVTGSSTQSVTLTILGGNGVTNAATGNGVQFDYGVIADGNFAGGDILNFTLNTQLPAADGIVNQINSIANTFSGAVTIADGALQVASLANTGTASSLGTGSTTSTITMGTAGQADNIELSLISLSSNNANAGTQPVSTNRTIDIVGTGGSVTLANNSANSAAALTLSSITIENGGGKTLVLSGTNTGANTISSSITNDPSDGGLTALSKTGAGLWILTGTNNTFSGAVTISAGTLEVGSASSLGAGTSITLSGGNLLLTNAGNIGASQAITINSGGIGVAYAPASLPTITDNTGTAGGIYGLNYATSTSTGGLQAVGGVASVNALFTTNSYWFLGSFTSGTYEGAAGDLTPGKNNTYRLGGGGGVLTVANPILVDSGGSSSLIVGGTGGGTVILPTGNTYSGTTTLQNGTLTIASQSSLGSGTSAIVLGSTTNAVDLNYAGSGETIARGLTFAGTTGTVTLSNSGTGNVVYGGATSFSGSGSKTLDLGNATDIYGGSVGAIANGSGTGNKTAVVENGLTNDTWTLTGGSGNTYTGGTTIDGGVLQTTAATDILTDGGLALTGTLTHDAIFQTSGTITTALATNSTTVGAVDWGVYGGFAAYGGTLTLNFGGSGTSLVWGGTNDGFMGSGTTPMVFGSSTANNQVILQNSVDFGAASTNFNRTIDVEGAAATIVGGASNYGVTGNNALLSGALTALNGTGNNGFVKTGAGTLILGNAASTYSGSTIIGAGTLVLGGSTSSTASFQSTNATAAGAVAQGATSLTLASASGVSVGELVVGAGIAAGTTVTAVNTATGVITLSTGTTAAIAAGTDTLTFGQSGVLGLSTAAIVLGSGNINGSDGTNATGASPTVLIGGAYTVANPISIANIATSGTYGLGGSTDNSATFAGNISTAGQNFTITQVATTGGHALTLGGNLASTVAGTTTVTFNNAGAVTVSGAVQTNGTDILALTKSNTGLLTLSGANTYTGATTINAGSVAVTGSLANTAVTVASGGTLLGTGTIAGATTIAGSVTFGGGGILVAGDGVNTGTTLTFTGTSGVNLSAANSVLEFVLGSGGAHSVLALSNTGANSFGALQEIDFLGIQAGTYTNLITGLSSDPGSEANWVLYNDPGYAATFTYSNGDLSATILAVPEPPAWLLLGVGLGLACCLRLRSALREVGV